MKKHKRDENKFMQYLNAEKNKTRQIKDCAIRYYLTQKYKNHECSNINRYAGKRNNADHL